MWVEHIRAMFKMLQTHPGPHPTGHGESLPSSLFHMCGVQLLFGRSSLHCWCHLSDTLHRWFSQVLNLHAKYTIQKWNRHKCHLKNSNYIVTNRKYAPRCSVCGEPIMPEPGQEETVRIVALDRSFHVNCYICEVCQFFLYPVSMNRKYRNIYL